MPNLVTFVSQDIYNRVVERAQAECLTIPRWFNSVVKERLQSSSGIYRLGNRETTGLVRILGNASNAVKLEVQQRVRQLRFESEAELLYFLVVEALSKPARPVQATLKVADEVSSSDLPTTEHVKGVEEIATPALADVEPLDKLLGDAPLSERIDTFLDEELAKTQEKEKTTMNAVNARGCDEPGCSAKHRAKGYCVKHYVQHFPRLKGKKAEKAVKKVQAVAAAKTVKPSKDPVSPDSKRPRPSAKTIKEAAAEFSSKDVPSWPALLNRRVGHVYPRIEIAISVWSQVLAIARKSGVKPERAVASLIADAVAGVGV